MYTLKENITTMECIGDKKNDQYTLAIGTDMGNVYFRENWGDLQLIKHIDDAKILDIAFSPKKEKMMICFVSSSNEKQMYLCEN